jgi:hypothetical protein
MSGACAVVVTWNSEDVILRCLWACHRYGVPAVVIDNASTDRSVEMAKSIPGTRVIANPQNRGFAGAVNQGVGLSDSAFILLMNPDVELLGPVDELERVLEAGSGAAAGAMVDGSGAIQRGFSVRSFPTTASLCFEVLGLNRLWKNNPVNRRYRCLDMDMNTAAEVDQPAGAFLMVSREAWRRTGGMDEKFFPVWFEDVDLCLRLKKCGFRITYNPSAKARHVGGHSIQRMSRSERRLYWYRSLLQYSLKHQRAVQRGTVCLAVMMGALLKVVPEGLQGDLFGTCRVYGKVIQSAWLALRGIWSAGYEHADLDPAA